MSLYFLLCLEYAWSSAQASSKAIFTNHQTLLLSNILTPVARIQLIGSCLNSYVASKDQEDLGLNIDETPQICLQIYLKQWYTCVFFCWTNIHICCALKMCKVRAPALSYWSWIWKSFFFFFFAQQGQKYFNKLTKKKKK